MDFNTLECNKCFADDPERARLCNECKADTMCTAFRVWYYRQNKQDKK